MSRAARWQGLNYFKNNSDSENFEVIGPNSQVFHHFTHDSINICFFLVKYLYVFEFINQLNQNI